jgi:chromosome segregation ATPase
MSKKVYYQARPADTARIEELEAQLAKATEVVEASGRKRGELEQERDRWKDAYRAVSRDLNLVVPDNDRLRSERDAAEAKLAQAVEALEAIQKRAAPHPDDDDNERKRQLMHIHSKAIATLAAIKGEAR